MIKILKNWDKIIFTLSVLAIIFALTAEHVFNLFPCKMCLHQRYPYYFIIVVLVICYFLKTKPILLIYPLIQIAIIYGLFYSIWHVGIEQNILQAPAECSSTLDISNSTEDLKQQLSNQEIVNCSDVGWSIIGLSAATWNSFLLLFFLFFNSIYIYKTYYEKKKKN